MTSADVAAPARTSGATLVLLTLAAGQFLMTLDSSVMNVSIATVAKDLGTTVTGMVVVALFYAERIPTTQPTGGETKRE